MNYVNVFYLFALLNTKKPVALFTCDKTTYVAGETVKLSNISKYAYSYIWTLPNGEVKTRDAEFSIDVNEPDGIKTIRLKAISKNGKKFNEIEKTINVTHKE